MNASAPAFFLAFAKIHLPFTQLPLKLLVREQILSRVVFEQLKGGDPMSSEKPGEAIGSVSGGDRVEQPLRAN